MQGEIVVYGNMHTQHHTLEANPSCTTELYVHNRALKEQASRKGRERTNTFKASILARAEARTTERIAKTEKHTQCFAKLSKAEPTSTVEQRQKDKIDTGRGT